MARKCAGISVLNQTCDRETIIIIYRDAIAIDECKITSDLMTSYKPELDCSSLIGGRVAAAHFCVPTNTYLVTGPSRKLNHYTRASITLNTLESETLCIGHQNHHPATSGIL